MGKDYLGELEELILTTVGILDGEAYGNSIIAEIEQQLGRSVTLPAAHVTLSRLEQKGYLRSRIGGATSVRGGRRKRIYTITNSGIAILRSAQENRLQLWRLVPQLKLKV